jgi:hypothetical protein
VRKVGQDDEVDEAWAALDAVEAMRGDFVCGGDLNAEMNEDGTISDTLLSEMCEARSLTSLQPIGPTYKHGETGVEARLDHWLVNSTLLGAMRTRGRTVPVSDHWGVNVEYTSLATNNKRGWGDVRLHKPRMHKLSDDDDWKAYAALTSTHVATEIAELERIRERGEVLLTAC